MNNVTTTIKHLAYTLVTILTLAFGLTMLEQSQELNDAAKFISMAIIAFSGYLSYELITTDDYKLMPMLAFGAAVTAMLAAMCFYG